MGVLISIEINRLFREIYAGMIFGMSGKISLKSFAATEQMQANIVKIAARENTAGGMVFIHGTWKKADRNCVCLKSIVTKTPPLLAGRKHNKLTISLEGMTRQQRRADQGFALFLFIEKMYC